jgi:hypothetical protein
VPIVVLVISVLIVAVVVVDGLVPVDLIEGVPMVLIMVVMGVIVVVMVLVVVVPIQPAPRGAVAVGPAPAVPGARSSPQGQSLLLGRVGEPRCHRRTAVRERQAGEEHHGKANSTQP